VHLGLNRTKAERDIFFSRFAVFCPKVVHISLPFLEIDPDVASLVLNLSSDSNHKAVKTKTCLSVPE